MENNKTRIAEYILIFILMLGFFAYSVSLFATNLIFVDEKILWRCWGEKVNSICVIIFACGSMLLAIMESFKSDVKELCQFYFYILKAGIILLFGTLLFVLINRYRLPDYIFQLWNYLLVFVILTVVLSLIIFIKIRSIILINHLSCFCILFTTATMYTIVLKINRLSLW